MRGCFSKRYQRYKEVVIIPNMIEQYVTCHYNDILHHVFLLSSKTDAEDGNSLRA